MEPGNFALLFTMAPRDEDADPHGGRRFPFIPLKQAIERTRILHKNGGNHPIPVAQAAQLWGYSEKASGWRQTIASLRYYRLIQAVGVKEARQIRLTEAARRYFLDERPEEHARLHAEFAIAPSALAALWEMWHADPPSDPVARSILKTQFHYPENAAAQLLSIYKANLAFAALATRSQDRAQDGSAAQMGTGITPTLEVAAAPSRGSGLLNQPAARHEERARIMENERELTTGMLSKDANFRLIVSGKIGAKEIDRLIRKLEVDKEILAEHEAGPIDEGTAPQS